MKRILMYSDNFDDDNLCYDLRLFTYAKAVTSLSQLVGVSVSVIRLLEKL